MQHAPHHSRAVYSPEKVRVCARGACLCFQRQCPGCGVHKLVESFQRHSTCWECRSSTSTSTTNITSSVEPSSFLRFFNRETSQGSHLSLIQRSALIILHHLNFDISQIDHLTHCDPRTIQHWIDYYQMYTHGQK